MVAKAVGGANIVEVVMRDTGTGHPTVDTDLIRMAAAILTAATGAAYHLFLPPRNADQHGDEMTDQILDCLQDRHQSPATIFLMMGGDLMDVTGIDLDLVI
jgi:hypothetical protein